MELKRMRFNLRFLDPRGSENFVTVHSVKELRDCLENRMIAFDDLIGYFRNGTLHRWLECQDEVEANRAEKMKKLFEDGHGKAVADIATPLLDAFDMEIDNDVVDAFVRDCVISPEKMLQDKMCARKWIDAYKIKASELVDEFKKDKSRLLEMRENLKALRKYVAQMLQLYGGLSRLDEFHFIGFLKKKCPLGALALLTLPEGQKYKDDLPDIFKGFVVLKSPNCEPTLLLNWYTDLEKEHPYLVSGDNAPIKVYRKETKRRSWESIVQAGTKVLLLWDVNYVVSDFGADKEKDQFEGDKLNGNYHVFNGLDVRSKDKISAFSELFLAYIEVPNDGE